MSSEQNVFPFRSKARIERRRPESQLPGSWSPVSLHSAHSGCLKGSVFCPQNLWWPVTSFHQKILWTSSGEYDSYLWRKRPRDLRVSCVPGRLALLLLHRCWFSRTRIEAEESSTVPKKTLVQSLDLCCLSGQCFVLKNQRVKHFTIHSGTCPELTFLLRWQLLPCWTRARWHLQRQDAVFPILPPVFCVRLLHAKKTMISFEMEQTRGSVWSASSKTQWQSQGWVGFSRRIRVPSSDTAGLGGKEATFSSGKGAGERVPLNWYELYISTQTASKQFKNLSANKAQVLRKLLSSVCSDFYGDTWGCVSAGSALIRPKKLKGRSKALQCLRLAERWTLGPQTLVSFFGRKDPF